MAELYAVGITSIKIGAIAGDGGMGTSLTSLGSTFEGTVNFEQDDAAVTEFYSEEADDPIYQSKKAGLKKFNWAIVDWTPENMVRGFGGTVTGSGESAVWHSPSTLPTVEMSVEIITTSLTKYEITRASLVAKISASLGRSSMGQMPIVATVLAPTKVGEAALRVRKSS
jgi:hypothetical protein